MMQRNCYLTLCRPIDEKFRNKKKLKDLDDMICLIKEIDSDTIPVFVARDL